MKSREGKSQRREEKRREEKKKGDQKGKSLRRKKIQVREKVGNSRNTVFFQWFVAPGGRKVGSLKRRVRSQQMRGEKLHAFVARSTFQSQKCKKTDGSGALLEVEMSKNCTPLWRESHFEVKTSKTPNVRTALGSWDVEKVHAVVARSTFRSQKCKKLRGSEHFWTFRCRFTWQAQGIVHPVKSEQNVRVLLHFQLQPPPLHYTPLHYNYNYNCTYTTFHYTTLHYNYNYTTLHSTTLHYTPLHYIQLHYTTLHYITLHYTTFHYATLP